MKYRNAQSVDASAYIVDCEIDHPAFGWIPYTLDPDDADMSIDNAALLAAMDINGDVADYVVPSPTKITVQQVKDSARRRILSLVSLEQQLNLNMQANILNNIGRTNWTAAQLAAWDAGIVIADRVTAIRAASNLIEADNPIAQSFEDDDRWP